MNIKKNIAIVLSFVLILSIVFPCFMLAGAQGDFAGGDGTMENPYLIATKEHLNNVRNYSSNSTFKFINDIVFEDEDFEEGGAFYNDGQGFLPIGGGKDSTFSGTVLGEGHSIIGLRQKIKGKGSAGLFGSTDEIVIKDLTIKDSYFEVKAPDGGFVAIGAFVGSIHDNGSIINCRNENSSINAIKSATASDAFYVGGIVGGAPVPDYYTHIYNIEIKDCINTGDITAEQLAVGVKACIGGILGGTNIEQSSMENCHNSGNISVTKIEKTAIGGVAGTIADVKRCSNTGDIKAEKGAPDSYLPGGDEPCFAGIVGHANRVEECFNTGNITLLADESGMRLNIGGLVGKLEDNMKNSFNSGKMSIRCNEVYAGGLIGRDSTSENITNSYNVGQVTVTTPEGAFRAVGALFGYSYGTDNTGCYFLSGTCENAKGYGGSAEYDAEVSKTNEEMTKQETFKEYDFETVWTMDASENYPYPELKEVKMPEGYEPQKPEKTPEPTPIPTPIPELTPTVDIPFAGGDGTEQNPYRIATKAQLNNVRNHLKSHFILENDIVFEEADFQEGGEFYNYGQGFMPIGHWTEEHDWEDGNGFSGTFNGNGFAISGLYQHIKGRNAGLFGRVDTAKIYDLTIKNSSFTAETDKSCQVAALAAWAYDVKIRNCRIESDVTVTAIGGAYNDERAWAGGFIGYSYEYSSILLSVNKAAIRAERAGEVCAGGLLARGTGDFAIAKSCNEGAIYAKSELGKFDKVYAGGIIGSFTNYEGIGISDSYNAGEVTAEGAKADSTIAVGGIIGCVDSNEESPCPAFRRVHNVGLVRCIGGENVNVNPMIAIADFKESDWYGPIQYFAFENCYYLDSCTDKEVAERTGVAAFSDKEFKKQASFSGWDFEELWKIDGEYPTLLLLDVITKLGDVTLDNKLNSRDLATMQKMILSIGDDPDFEGYGYDITLAEMTLSDINYDNDFNSRDIAYLQRILVS